MIRRFVIVAMTVATVGVGALGLLTLHYPLWWSAGRAFRAYVGDAVAELSTVVVQDFATTLADRKRRSESGAITWSSNRDNRIEFIGFGLYVEYGNSRGSFGKGITPRLCGNAVRRRQRSYKRSTGSTSAPVATNTKPTIDVTYRVRIPLWMPVMLFGAWPAVAFLRGPLRRRRRRKRGECVHCGYNLTGLPEPRCPECGKGSELT